MEFEELEKQREKSVAAATKIAPHSSGGMTLRERFQRVMHYQNADKLPNFEFGYWSSTLSDWHRQGLPEEITDQNKAYAYFGIEDFHYAPVNTGMKINWFGKTVEETAEKRVYYDIYGALCEINTQGIQSIPRFLQFPVRDRKSWLEYRQERLLDDADRYPKNWDEFADKSRNRDYPLGIGIGSMIGVPRNLIGFENIAICRRPMARAARRSWRISASAWNEPLFAPCGMCSLTMPTVGRIFASIQDRLWACPFSAMW